MLKLFHNAASPFVRKVMVVLHEADRAEEVELIHSVGGPLATENMPLAENPLGKLPTLVRPDGPALYDSRVICRYLDDHFDAGLYPVDRQWDVLTLEATADGIMDAAVMKTYEGRWRPEELQYAPWVEAQWDKIDRALDAVEARWMPLLAGPVHIGQIAMGCALGYLDFRHAERDWRAGRADLPDWYAGFLDRASMQATLPEG